MALFHFGGFFRVSDFTGSTSRYNDFDGHLMVSKIVIEFFPGLTATELQQFV